MTAGVYFGGADATLTAGGASVAAIHGWSFVLSWEVNDLYGSGSFFMIASAKHHQKIDVKLNYAKFDPAATFIASSLKGNASSGPHKGSIYDTSQMYSFDVVGNIDAFPENDGNTGSNLEATITGVYLDGIPFDLPEMDWVALNLTGIGRTLTWGTGT